MPFKDRLELARNSEIGQKLFPLECGAQFRTVSGIDILCLTEPQLKTWLAERPSFQDHYPSIHAIGDDPVPMLGF